MNADNAPERAVPTPHGQRLTGRLELRTAMGAFLGDTRVRLLEAIAREGSISQAARHVPLSYKAAWDAVDAMNNLAEAPLVERTTGGRAGGGTRLTDYGRRVIAMYRAVEAEHQAALDRLADRFAREPDADVAAFQRLIRRLALRTSARNHFIGTVTHVVDAPVHVEIGLRVGEGPGMVAVVTRESTEHLGLAPGVEVVALIKASSLQLGPVPEEPGVVLNRIEGTVVRVVADPDITEVTLDLGGGRSATSVVARAVAESLDLSPGARVEAAFKGTAVILAVLD